MPGATVELFAQLNDAPFAWSEFRNPFLTLEDREWLLQQRIEDLRERNASLLAFIREIGATDIELFGGAAGASFVLPVGRMADLAAIRQHVQWVKYDIAPVQPLGAYTGVEVRNGTKTGSIWQWLRWRQRRERRMGCR